MTEKKRRPNPSTISNEFRALMLLPLVTIVFVLGIAWILM